MLSKWQENVPSALDILLLSLNIFRPNVLWNVRKKIFVEVLDIWNNTSKSLRKVRSSHPRSTLRKPFLNIFPKFTRKYLRWRSFLNNMTSHLVCNCYIDKGLCWKYFPVNLLVRRDNKGIWINSCVLLKQF